MTEKLFKTYSVNSDNRFIKMFFETENYIYGESINIKESKKFDDELYLLYNTSNETGVSFKKTNNKINVEIFTEKDYSLFEELETIKNKPEEYLEANKDKSIFLNEAYIGKDDLLKIDGGVYKIQKANDTTLIKTDGELINFLGLTAVILPLLSFAGAVSAINIKTDSQFNILELNQNVELIKINATKPDTAITKEEILEFSKNTNDILEKAFNYLVEVSEALKVFNQIDYKRPNSLSYPMAKTVRHIFKLNLDETEDILLDLEIDLAGRKSKKEVVNTVSINLPQPLNMFDYLVFCAYYTLVKENSNEYIAYLDIANTIHKSKNKSKLENNDSFVNEVRASVRKLRATVIDYLDFTQEAKKHNKKGLKGLLENNKTRIEGFNLIMAYHVNNIKKPNGTILDGLAPAKGEEAEAVNNAFFNYIKATDQIKTLPEEFLISPFRAKADNEMLLHYLLYQLSNMPYYAKGKKLIFSENEEENKNKENHRSLKYKDNNFSININNLIKNLNLKERRSRVTEKIEKVFNQWIKNNLIVDYKINYKGRSKKSYTLIIH